MRSILVFLLVVFAVLIDCKHVNKREVAEDSTPSLQDLVTRAQKNMETFAASVQDLFTPGEEQQATLSRIGENLSDRSRELAERVQSLVNNLDKAIKDGDHNKAWEDAAQRLNATFRRLVGDDTANQAEEASAKVSREVKEAVEAVVEETGRIAKQVQSDTAPLRDELGMATRSALNQALEVAEYFQQQVRDAVHQQVDPPAAAA